MYERELHNVEDCYAMAIKKDETVIGHFSTSLLAMAVVFKATELHKAPH